MPSYPTYTADEFAQDDFFRRWVQSPDEKTNSFWQQFLAEHPHQQRAVAKARAFLRAVDQSQTVPSAEQGQRMWAVIDDQINEEPENEVDEVRTYQIGWRWWAAAASTVLMLGVGWWFFQVDQTPTIVSDTPTPAEAVVNLLEKTNDSDKPLTIQLADGSSVILQPRSQLRYPAQFTGDLREVQLTGEGFFQIARNPKKPFLVYANELVTKVLGTSFTVRAFEKDKQVTVEVRTGRVSVFARTEAEKVAQQSVAGMVLLPNQKVVFDRNDARLTKSLVQQPAILVAPTQPNAFEFDDTPAPQVFAQLERAYGIDIVFDKELLADCPLTASLTNQPLYDKLNVICKALEARYEVIDGQIVIYSKGCQ